jgi:hypothetical protein
MYDILSANSSSCNSKSVCFSASAFKKAKLNVCFVDIPDEVSMQATKVYKLKANKTPEAKKGFQETARCPGTNPTTSEFTTTTPACSRLERF